ncbi:MAG: trypsin-like serine protease [bacterium]
MPEPADPTIPAGPLGRVVTRDLVTGAVTYTENVSRDEFLNRQFTPGGEGALDGLVRDPTGGGKNFSSWSQVMDPTIPPYPTHVKVWIDWDGSNGGVCSGTLIDPKHVITAGHCIYTFDPAYPGWADEVSITPGYEFGVAPFGSARVVQMHSWEGWTVDEDSNHDNAILDLDRPIGALTGWRGYGYNTDCDWFENPTWYHASYPAEDPFDGEILFENNGDYDGCSGTSGYNIIEWFMPSWGGSSGGGAVRDNVVYATQQGSDRETRSTDTKITAGKFSDIGAIRDADLPASPDIMPIFVQAEDESFGPGQQLDAFSFVMASYADVGLSQNVICDIYLSADEYITTGDVWLDDLTVAVNLPAMSGQFVGVYPPPTIPVTTTPGRYFLGVIANITDANTSNNTTAAVELDSVFVSCPLPGSPTITSPSEGEVCQPVNRTIDWTDLPDIEIYQLQIGTWCGGGTTYNAGNASQYTVYGLDNGVTYLARVRAKKYCGSWGAWSGCRSFTTIDIPTSDVHFLTPSNYDICQDSTLVTIGWSIVPDATGYELRVGENCYSGNTYSLPSSTPYKDVTGLAGDTTYRYLVRVKGECGNWGDWSECRTFSTLPGLYFIPHSPFPADGWMCASPNTNLSWWPADYPCTYEVEWGRSCRMDTSAFTPTNVFDLPTMAGGVWYWHVRAIHVCGGVGSWSFCYSYGVDDIPPYWPDWLVSDTHAVSTWSTNPAVTTNWENADDPCNAEYRVLWDHAPATVPDELVLTINEIEYTSKPLLDGDDHWFHVLAKDMPGNLADHPQHLGPFWIDTTAPDVEVLNPLAGQIFLGGTVMTIAWTADDATSGIATTQIDYTIDGAANWVPIATITDPLVFTQDWTVPVVTANYARVRVWVTDQAGNYNIGTQNHWFSIVESIGVDDPGGGAPVTRFVLADNYPNPFNPCTTIRFAVPRREHLRLGIFDLFGRRVNTLHDGPVDGPAWYEMQWNGQNSAGQQVAAGIYFCRLETDTFCETKRMMLVK